MQNNRSTFTDFFIEILSKTSQNRSSLIGGLKGGKHFGRYKKVGIYVYS